MGLDFAQPLTVASQKAFTFPFLLSKKACLEELAKHIIAY